MSGSSRLDRRSATGWNQGEVALPDKFWIVSSISARVKGFEMISSTAVLSRD